VARSAVTMTSATSSSSSGLNPNVVSAGVPSRMPEVYQAPLESPGMDVTLVLSLGILARLQRCLRAKVLLAICNRLSRGVPGRSSMVCRRREGTMRRIKTANVLVSSCCLGGFLVLATSDSVGGIVAPSNGAVITPSNGDITAPSNGDITAPANGGAGAISGGDNGAPSNGETGAPSNGDTGAPSNGDTGAPSNGDTGAPSSPNGKGKAAKTKGKEHKSKGNGNRNGATTKDTGAPSSGDTGPSSGDTGAPSSPNGKVKAAKTKGKEHKSKGKGTPPTAPNGA